MQLTRRQTILGGAALMSTAGLGISVSAQEDSPFLFVDVNAERESVTIKNVSSEEIDVSEYGINFEVGQNEDQIRRFSEGTWSQEDTVLSATETLTIATGARDVQDADVTFNYTRGEIRNDGSDVVGIVNPDSELLIRSDDDSHYTSDESSETETPEETTEEPTETPEKTPTEEPSAEEPTDEEMTEQPENGDDGSSSDDTKQTGDNTEDGEQTDVKQGC